MIASVGLSKAHNQNTVVGRRPVLRETLVCRECQSPEIGVSQALTSGAADVLLVVPERPKTIHRHPRYVLVDEDAHPLEAGDLDRRDLLLSQTGRVVERGHYIRARQKRIFSH